MSNRISSLPFVSNEIASALEAAIKACCEHRIAWGKYCKATRKAHAKCEKLFKGELLIHQSAEAQKREKQEEKIWAHADRLRQIADALHRTTRREAIVRLSNAILAETGKALSPLIFDARPDYSFSDELLAKEIAEVLTAKDEARRLATIRTLKPVKMPVAGLPVIECSPKSWQCGTLQTVKGASATVLGIRQDYRFKTSLRTLREVPHSVYQAWIGGKARFDAIVSEVSGMLATAA